MGQNFHVFLRSDELEGNQEKRKSSKYNYQDDGHISSCPIVLELITFEILAAERLRLMGFDNRLIIDCFAKVVNILIWLFSTNDRFRSEKYDSNHLENPFPDMKRVNLLSKTHCNYKSNLRPKTVLEE